MIFFEIPGVTTLSRIYFEFDTILGTLIVVAAATTTLISAIAILMIIYALSAIPRLIYAFIMIKNIEVIKTNNADYTNLLSELKSYLKTAKMFLLLPILILLILIILEVGLSSSPLYIIAFANFIILNAFIMCYYIITFTLTNILLNNTSDFKGITKELLVCTKTILSRPFSYIILTLIILLIIILLGILVIPLIWLVPFLHCVGAVLYTKENFDK
ncbi:MAG: hypothetical protein ACOX3T_03510 [Bdellovibrionota bacterium]